VTTTGNPGAPAFGQADLTNCEREQIHLAGSIQPHGALLLVRENDRKIVQCSTNLAEFLEISELPLDRALSDLGDDFADSFERYTRDPLRTLPRSARIRLRQSNARFEALVHRPAGGGVVVELERAAQPVDYSVHVQKALEIFSGCSTHRALADATAEILKDVTGYDRVMVYRFDEDGHGEVFAEKRAEHLEPYLGNHYPASDIPQMARRLYERNRVRVLVDVEYQPVPLQPRLSPLTGEDLDMSMCSLRSMSPIHIQYLKNMGVQATLVVSLVVGGSLWGLIACHHYEPRLAPYEMRTTCELLAEVIATRIAALESFAHTQADLSVRRLQQRLAESITRHGDWKSALFDSTQAILSPTSASGAALFFEDTSITAGEVPGTGQLREIRDWLDGQPHRDVYATHTLADEDPRFLSLKSIASGLLAVPISSSKGEYFVWFRPERVQTITWGGNPNKPVEISSDPTQLSPRRSFDQWRQIVEGQSARWSAAERAAAMRIGRSIGDIILQYRSVRMLIAEDQLRQIRQQVRVHELPVVITNASGRISLINESFAQLIGGAHPHFESIEDLAACFEPASESREILSAIHQNLRPWVGEMHLRNSLGAPRPLLVKADPVISSNQDVLGVVMTFADSSERVTAAAARQKFQTSILENKRMPSDPLDFSSNMVFRRLYSRIISNAQLAALEITDGMQLSDIPRLLEQLRVSVTRSELLLNYLLTHSRESSDDKNDGER
jgi:light-regulated signal transduction histidine kinase (bacteriophytochrome)